LSYQHLNSGFIWCQHKIRRNLPAVKGWTCLPFKINNHPDSELVYLWNFGSVPPAEREEVGNPRAVSGIEPRYQLNRNLYATVFTNYAPICGGFWGYTWQEFEDYP
jgi:hypothetical protein